VGILDEATSSKKGAFVNQTILHTDLALALDRMDPGEGICKETIVKPKSGRTTILNCIDRVSEIIYA